MEDELAAAKSSITVKEVLTRFIRFYQSDVITEFQQQGGNASFTFARALTITELKKISVSPPINRIQAVKFLQF